MQHNENLEKKLKELYGFAIEVNEPYVNNGEYEMTVGNYAADVFYDGSEMPGVDDLLAIFAEIDRDDDIITDKFGTYNVLQIIIKSKETLELFKEAITKKLLYKNEKLSKNNLYFHDLKQRQKTYSELDVQNIATVFNFDPAFISKIVEEDNLTKSITIWFKDVNKAELAENNIVTKLEADNTKKYKKGRIHNVGTGIFIKFDALTDFLEVTSSKQNTLKC